MFVALIPFWLSNFPLYWTSLPNTQLPRELTNLDVDDTKNCQHLEGMKFVFDTAKVGIQLCRSYNIHR